MLEVRHITMRFPGVIALDDVSFDLREGEVHCLVGENGAGKSTLVKVLAGAYPDYEGQIIMGGRPVHIRSPKDARQLGIAAIHQERDLVPTLNAIENCFLNHEFKTKYGTIDRRRMQSEARELIGRFGVSVNLDIPVGRLAVNEQQVIAIAKALSSECSVLMMDEASAPLDRGGRRILFDIVRGLREEGKSVIYISHNIEEVFEIGDRVTIFRDGKKVATRAASETSATEVIQLMIGRDVKTSRRPQSRHPGEVVLSVSNLCVGELIRDVNFSVRKGEVLGITGLVSSNKERIAEAIYGLVSARKGLVRVKGLPLLVSSPPGALRMGIGLVPRDRRQEGLVLCRSVGENIVLSKINKEGRNFVRPRLVRELAQKFVRALRIVTPSLEQRVAYLSGGNQQKVVLAKSLASECDILILVEPTEGIDVNARWELYGLLTELADKGKALVLISSDVDEICALCDRVLVMREGQVVREFLYHEVSKGVIWECMIPKNVTTEPAQVL